MRSGRKLAVFVAGWISLGLMFGLSIDQVRAGNPKLTPAAEAAVLQRFPAASILEIGREREAGVPYFEVVVMDGNQLFEIEVTADGTLGEVETAVALSGLPSGVREEIRQLGGSVGEIERHEIHGVVTDGRFATLATPMITYAVHYEADGTRAEALLSPDGRRLSTGQHDSDSDEGSSSDSDSSSDEGASSGDGDSSGDRDSSLSS